MGLAPVDESPSVLSGWAIPAVLAVLAVAAQAAGLAGELRYERAAIESGESWRLLSAHVVHLGWPHLLMNLAGLALVWLLVGAAFGRRQWCVVLALTVTGIDIAFWWLSPELGWYVGLSGLLHGLLVAGAIALVVQGSDRRVESLVLLALVAAKLAWEQVAGPVPGSAGVAGGAVVVDSHLYGAVAGLVAGLAIALHGRRHETHRPQ